MLSRPSGPAKTYREWKLQREQAVMSRSIKSQHNVGMIGQQPVPVVEGWKKDPTGNITISDHKVVDDFQQTREKILSKTSGNLTYSANIKNTEITSEGRHQIVNPSSPNSVIQFDWARRIAELNLLPANSKSPFIEDKISSVGVHLESSNELTNKMATCRKCPKETNPENEYSPNEFASWDDTAAVNDSPSQSPDSFVSHVPPPTVKQTVLSTEELNQSITINNKEKHKTNLVKNLEIMDKRQKYKFFESLKRKYYERKVLYMNEPGNRKINSRKMKRYDIFCEIRDEFYFVKEYLYKQKKQKLAEPAEIELHRPDEAPYSPTEEPLILEHLPVETSDIVKMSPSPIQSPLPSKLVIENMIEPKEKSEFSKHIDEIMKNVKVNDEICSEESSIMMDPIDDENLIIPLSFGKTRLSPIIIKPLIKVNSPDKLPGNQSPCQLSPPLSPNHSPVYFEPINCGASFLSLPSEIVESSLQLEGENSTSKLPLSPQPVPSTNLYPASVLQLASEACTLPSTSIKSYLSNDNPEDLHKTKFDELPSDESLAPTNESTTLPSCDQPPLPPMPPPDDVIPPPPDYDPLPPPPVPLFTFPSLSRSTKEKSPGENVLVPMMVESSDNGSTGQAHQSEDETSDIISAKINSDLIEEINLLSSFGIVPDEAYCVDYIRSQCELRSRIDKENMPTFSNSPSAHCNSRWPNGSPRNLFSVDELLSVVEQKAEQEIEIVSIIYYF